MIKKIAIILSGIILWFLPHPTEISPEAWHLFAIFFTTILSIVIGAFNILVASVFGMVIAVTTGTIDPGHAFSGFSNDIVLLIVVAFLIAKAVVKSGLGNRIALLMIRRFGKTTLGLGYSLIATDMIIAPAFPSNTARSGLLFPIIYSISMVNGSDPEKGTEKKLGSFLMFASMFGIGLSSAMWLTAMAANPAGAAIAESYGVNIGFGTWVLASFVPTIIAAIVIPWVLYKIYPPQMKLTPNAPIHALEELKKMGKMSRDEIITAIVFAFLVIFWALSDVLNINKTIIAFLGLGLLLVTNVFKVKEIKKEGEALTTMIWFSILYIMSSQLNELGFMDYVGNALAIQIEGLNQHFAFFLLVFVYIIFHYLFVSQTAHMLALLGVFLGAGKSLGIDTTSLALMLLFATNYFSVITPQGSSCNILYISSGYITPKEVYKYGGILTFLSFVIYMVFGLPWISLVM
ncbi:MAG: DASS family sodium-coupled anion symporter [Bacteroidetes bacterium]|nr:DASS family sodium-coupled anion symporter [Bacteroidota bacterium]